MEIKLSEKEKERRAKVMEAWLHLRVIHQKIDLLIKKCGQELNALNHR